MLFSVLGAVYVLPACIKMISRWEEESNALVGYCDLICDSRVQNIEFSLESTRHAGPGEHILDPDNRKARHVRRIGVAR